LSPQALAARTVGRTLLDNFADAVDAAPRGVALRQRVEDHWQELTWSEYAELAARFAAALAAAGIGRGDMVGLLLRNRIEHYVADLGCLLAGAVPTSIYLTSSSEQIRWLLDDSQCRVVVVDGPAEAGRLDAVRAELPQLEYVLATGGPPDGDALAFDAWLHATPMSWDTARRATSPADVATVIYTSGTTGLPKAAEHTHAGLVAMAESVLHLYGEDFVGKRIISYLPLAHIAERGNSYYSATRARQIVTCCPEIAELADHVRAVRPQLLFGPPRMWERLSDEMYAAGDPATDAEVMRRLVGLDAVEIAATGAATLPPHVDQRLRAVGITLADMYGSTEFPSATGSPRQHRRGTSGRPCPGVEARLAPDGELQLSGPAAFRGYRGDEEATAAAFTTDGFVRTGDLATIDDDGYVTLVGRKRDVIIPLGGHNVAPAPLESRIMIHPLVRAAVVVGEAREYLAALVVLDPLAAHAWAGEHGLEGASLADLAARPELRADIEDHVDNVNRGVAPSERVRKIVILDHPWTPASEELTPTMKVRRAAVLVKYRAEIEAIYD
jgi:long-chain acyl-CoA synthetase